MPSRSRRVRGVSRFENGGLRTESNPRENLTLFWTGSQRTVHCSSVLHPPYTSTRQLRANVRASNASSEEKKKLIYHQNFIDPFSGRSYNLAAVENSASAN